MKPNNTNRLGNIEELYQNKTIDVLLHQQLLLKNNINLYPFWPGISTAN